MLISPVLIGSFGVGLLLLAFILNVSKSLSELSRSYLTLNVVGSAMAAWYAQASGSIPFVVLELAWCAVAGVRLAQTYRPANPPTE